MQGAKRIRLPHPRSLRDNYPMFLYFYVSFLYCPMNYDVTKYRKIDWKHLMMFHWIINPGLLINEMIFGQRVPKVMLMERNSNKAWAERSHVPCPHCNTIHDGKTWNLTNKTMFRNWFGLYCPVCGGVISCLMNIGTFVVLAVTSPIWYWFRKPLYNKWLAKQPARYKNLDLETSDFQKHTWWQQGLGWGMWMFIAMTLLNMLWGEEITGPKLIFHFVWWMAGGLILGLFMRAMTHKAIKKQKASGN